nr:hypothetical protein [Mycoplasmopsis bovis]
MKSRKMMQKDNEEHAIARVKKVNTYQLAVPRPDNKGFVSQISIWLFAWI